MTAQAEAQTPQIGDLVEVRAQRWVVSQIEPSESATLVNLQSVEAGRYGETLEVIWEIEPGRRILPVGSLPDAAAGDFDPPQRLAAFLDAIRWSAVTSADVKTLQSPFRSGVAIEDYQLEPVARALDAPRVNLLLADDVGLGKTIEAGLVAQELRLRHRSRRIMIVCPAGLTLKWRDEMAEKFGLDFTIIDTNQCAIVRRTHGSAANPFEVYPLSIVSLPWLRGQKAQRLLDEILPAEGPGTQRTFDLLILDEAHHVAPAAPKQRYAVDSQQTKLIRRLAPHFTHRLFLSATPHNGYTESFTALLELIDDQRFVRGIKPDSAAVDEVVVRRLKTQIRNADGSRRFMEREASEIPVDYPQQERRIHGLLKEFAALRRERLRKNRRGTRAADLVTLLLKKRLFSSPAAFAHTVEVYLETAKDKVLRTPAGDMDEVPEWLDDFFDDTAALDDETLLLVEDDALGRSAPLQGGSTKPEIELLEQMHRWAITHTAKPDAKAQKLIDYLVAVCRPDGKHWTNERVVVFTEYRDTQQWLAKLLNQVNLGKPALELLHGGLPPADREQLRLAFQAEPTEHPVRILLATDAASEGIDLQNYCNRLVNYDIPFNPNKLEQRIGRIDRYGQKTTPDIKHFVGIGFAPGADSYEADLEFLSRVARKVARQEEDLGPVNAVISNRVQRRMLGQNVDIEDLTIKINRIPKERDVSGQVKRLRRTIDDTVEQLGITPRNVKGVVDTALGLANQQPLTSHLDEKCLADGLFTVPTLTGSWARASAGLAEKLVINGQVPKQRPVTFDPAVAKGRDDVVLAHLNHPLVSMSTQLLRAAVTNAEVGLHRITAVVSEHPALENILVGVYSQFVLVGADGVRLHEEVLHAGGWAPEQGRFRRLENLTMLSGILDHGLADGREASEPVRRRLAGLWPRISEGVLSAIEWRTRTRRESLANQLARREESEQARTIANLQRFEADLRAALKNVDDADDSDSLISLEELKDERERAQLRRDRQSWEFRLTQLAEERDRELASIRARYQDPRPHLFPVAVVFVVPKREATR